MPCPVFPVPLKNKASLTSIFFKKRRSWLDGLYDRSYKMKMGHVRMPGLELHMVNQPNLVRRIMIDEVAHFPKHSMLGDILAPLLGESIFTTNGAQWKRQREMLDPALDVARVQNVFALMQDAASDLMIRLDAVPAGNDIDIDAEMTYVTADIIFRTILSVDLDTKVARKIFDAFVLFQKLSPQAALKKMFNWPQWLDLSGKEKRWHKAGAEIRQSLETVIRPRYEAYMRNESGLQKDILASILDARDADGSQFTFDEIVDQAAMLFLAGHETSASALTWTLYLLALHPEIQEQAHSEVAHASQGEAFTVSNLKDMDLLRDIFREALRLYPPVGFLARECLQDTEMRGRKIDKSTSVVVAPWLIHRHRDLWIKPNDFDPFRYRDIKGKTPLRDIFLPFGMGPRVCIGTAFAMQEAVLILANILRGYKITLTPGFTPQPVGRLTIRSDNGMYVRLEKRQTS